MLFILLLSVLYLSQPSITLDDVRTAIKEKGYRWTAIENNISKLPDEIRLGMLRGKKPHIFTNQPVKTVNPRVFPSELDWRNYNGKNYVTSIKDQGNCGSCWAHAACAILESAILINTEQPGYDLDLSEQYLVSTCLGPEEGWDNDCNGGSPKAVVRFLTNHGTPDEACYPYRGRNSPCSDRCSDWYERIYQASSWDYANYPGMDWLKDKVYQAPLDVTFMVYYDFFYYSNGIYKHTTGGEAGLHDVAIIGWNDTDSCWICKNSWGAGWGERGFFRISYNANSQLSIETASLLYDKNKEFAFVLTPNGHEKYKGGDMVNIEWYIHRLPTIPDIISLYYTLNAGRTWKMISTLPDTNSYLWRVPEVNSDSVLIKVEDRHKVTVYDVSDSLFSIKSVGFRERVSLKPVPYNLTIKPQPVYGKLSISWYQDTTGDIELRLYSTTGKRVYSFRRIYPIGNNTLLMDFTEMPSGVYLLDFGGVTKPVVKIRR